MYLGMICNSFSYFINIDHEKHLLMHKSDGITSVIIRTMLLLWLRLVYLSSCLTCQFKNYVCVLFTVLYNMHVWNSTFFCDQGYYFKLSYWHQESCKLCLWWPQAKVTWGNTVHRVLWEPRNSWINIKNKCKAINIEN